MYSKVRVAGFARNPLKKKMAILDCLQFHRWTIKVQKRKKFQGTVGDLRSIKKKTKRLSTYRITKLGNVGAVKIWENVSCQLCSTIVTARLERIGEI